MPLRISRNRVALDGIPLNEGKSADVASASTIDIWSGTGNLVPITGTATISAFATAPQAGAKRTLLCVSTPAFTHGANFLLPGSTDYTATAGDRIEVLAITTTQFRLSILKASVLADVSFGPNAVTVGEGGQYSSMMDAINAIGDRLVLWETITCPVGAINGIAALSLNNPVFAHSSGESRVDMLVQIGSAATKYYKVRAVNETGLPGNVAYTLYEPFAETSIPFFTDTVRFYLINPVDLILLAGDHRSNPDASNATTLRPGYNIIGLNPYGMAISEVGSTPNFLFNNVGDNAFKNIRLAATQDWGDMDAVQGNGYTTNYGYGGAKTIFDNCVIDHRNQSTHSNGALYLPSPNEGVLIVRNTTIHTTRQPVISGVGRATRTVAGSICTFDNVTIIPDHDTDSVGIDANPNALLLSELGTYNFYNTKIIQQTEYNNEPLSTGYIWGDLSIQSASTVNIHQSVIDVKNTATTEPTYGLSVGTAATPSAATVNIFNSSIAAKGKTPVGIYNNGGTINLHNTYVEGVTNSINNVSGTVNVEKGCYLNGPVTGTLSSTIRGVVTLNGATPVTVTTTKVHTASRIKLSRQIAAGTQGHFGIGTITNNTSFTIVGQASDTSTVMWELEE